MPFRLVSNYSPTGDQPQAIDTLVQSLKKKNTYQTLLGVTGSGKTFTMANIIAKLDRPTLVIAHNKTLAAQLAQEFKEFFPDNAVHYFVSYYDYYQPEAYIVKSDTYIEKEATINEEIDRFRHAATESLLSRRDVIIVASVSCIYGIGEVADYEREVLRLKRGEEYSLSDILDQLVYLQYKRSIADFKPGMFRLHGDTLEIYPSSSEDVYILEFFGDTLDRISRTEYLTHHHLEDLDNFTLFPAKHFITPKDRLEVVIPKIRKELDERVEFFRSQGDLLRAERIKMRVEYDLEMLQETGFINGIENYSLYLSDRKIGSAPTTLMDYFPSDYLTFIDESHMTIPQIGGMYAGDRARKTNLIENGFRLPSAFENRPLRFEEFEKKINQAVFVSATPADYEWEHASVTAEQIIRPTGLIDPIVTVEDMQYVTDSLLGHIADAKKRGERSLITTLTKKSSEELAEYLAENGLKVKYLHSEVETIDRLDILRDLRLGKIEVIVGVNLLREGLDLPEVSFIGILDAEKIGFLRSTRSLLQIIGRASRNVNGHVVMYSTKKKLSSAMTEAIEETNRRRTIQTTYNEQHHIIPTTIISSIKDLGMKGKKKFSEDTRNETGDRDTLLKRLELEMDVAAANLEFEKAADLRDRIMELMTEKGK